MIYYYFYLFYFYLIIFFHTKGEDLFLPLEDDEFKYNIIILDNIEKEVYLLYFSYINKIYRILNYKKEL